MSKPAPLVIVRWVLAASVCAVGIHQLARVHREDLGWDNLGNTMGGVGALLVSLLFIGPEMVEWALMPMYAWVDRLLLPSESEPPPAAFKLARYYATLLRHEEACEEYAKIVRHHPEETDAYLEGIREAFLAGDAVQAKKFYRGAKRYLHTTQERQLLKGVYAARHEPTTSPEELEVLSVEPTDGTLPE